MNIEDIEKIYIQFRKAQSNFNSRGFRLPKDFESFFNNRIKENNKKALIKITGWFLTKWQNIDPYIYFKCGFELYEKKFTYVNFFKEKILLLYITKDKNKKREVTITKKNLLDSALFVKKWMNDNNATLHDYMTKRDDKGSRLVIDHYLKNKIDACFFVFLIKKGMILTDTDRSYIPYIQENFRKISFGLTDIKLFVKKMGDML